MNATSEAFRRLVEELERRALYGDAFAAQSLSAIALVASGWSYGDPDPEDPNPDGDGELVPYFDDQGVLGKRGEVIRHDFTRSRAARAA